jgi:hypothetical protein
VTQVLRCFTVLGYGKYELANMKRDENLLEKSKIKD